MQKKLMRLSRILLAVSILLTACQPVDRLAALVNNQPSPTPPPLSGPNASQLGASVLMMQQLSGMGNQQLVPIAAATGKPVAGYQPVDLGINPQTAFSQNRELLAFVTNGRGDCPQQCVYVLNLRTWQPAIPPVALPSSTEIYSWDQLAFDPSAKTLAVALNSPTSSSGQLYRVDLTQHKVTGQATLPFNTTQIGFTPGGSLALVGTAPLPGVKDTALQALLLDGVTLQTLWQPDLHEVRFSQDMLADPNDPSVGRYLNPAQVFTPDFSQLYLVAADEPRLFTLNWAAKTVRSVEIQPRKSLLERLLASTASLVYAKSLNGTTKSGVLSSDGRYLYVTGQTSTAVKDKTGNWTAQNTPLGLQVIDTRDGTELRHLNTDATEVYLDLDGKTLMLKGWKQIDSTTWQSWTDFLDPASLQVKSQVKQDLQPTRLLDGSLGWLTNEMLNNGGTYHLAIYRAGNAVPLVEWDAPAQTTFAYWLLIP
jgi:hypothetical protein